MLPSGPGLNLAAIVQSAYLAPSRSKSPEKLAFKQSLPTKEEAKPILKKFDYGESDEEEEPVHNMSSLLGNLRERSPKRMPVNPR